LKLFILRLLHLEPIPIDGHFNAPGRQPFREPFDCLGQTASLENETSRDGALFPKASAFAFSVSDCGHISSRVAYLPARRFQSKTIICKRRPISHFGGKRIAIFAVWGGFGGRRRGFLQILVMK
jgi:hypothetical protein